MKIRISIILIIWIVIFTAFVAAVVTAQVIAIRAIPAAVSLATDCLPHGNTEVALVNYLRRIEVKVDDVRETVTKLPILRGGP